VALVFFCMLRSICDGVGEERRLAGRGPCPELARSLAARAADGLAHCCLLQVAFLVLGPEDPKFAPRGTPRPPRRSSSNAVAWDTVFISRFVPAVIIFGSQICRAKMADEVLWQRAVEVDNILLCIGCSLFWLLSPGRRMLASEVLFRFRFWQRMWWHLVLPLACVSIVAIAAEATGRWSLRVLLHMAAAAAAASALKAVLLGRYDVSDRSPHNPIVAHCLLGGPTMIMSVTLCACLIGDWHDHGSWRWPTLSMASTSRLGSLVISLASLPLIIAAITSVWLVETTSGHQQLVKVLTSKGVGKLAPSVISSWRNECMFIAVRMAYVGSAFGLVTAVCAEGTLLQNRIHTIFAVLFFVFLWFMAILVTIAADRGTFIGRVRTTISALLVFGMPVHLAFFILVNQYISNDVGVPHSVYAISEYSHLVLFVAFPLMWVADVRTMRELPPLGCRR